jgi:hypothetical protein
MNLFPFMSGMIPDRVHLRSPMVKIWVFVVNTRIFQRNSYLRLLYFACINDLFQSTSTQKFVYLLMIQPYTYLSIRSETLQKDLSPYKMRVGLGHGVQPVQILVIHVTRSNHPIPTAYYLNGTILLMVTSVKYLRVDISN